MGRPPRLWNAALAALWTASFLVFLSFYMLLPVLPIYALRLGLNESAVGFVIGVFALTSMIFKPWAGWVMDWRGRRGILLAGAALFCAASLLYPLARSTATLFVLRIVHGAGMGLFPTAGAAVVADLAPPERRGEAMGLFGMASNLGMALGPAIGAVVDERLGFVPACLVAGVLALLGTVLALRVPETGVFAARPAFRPADLLAPRALQPALVTLALYLPYGGVWTFLPLLVRARGTGNAGVFFTVMALALLAVRTHAGQLSDRVGRRAVVLPALGVVAMAMAVLAVSHSAWGVYAAGFLFGLGVGGAQPALMAWAAELVAPADRGKAMATFYTAWELAIGAGSILFGLLLPSGGFEGLFTVAAAVALAGGAMTLVSPRSLPAGGARGGVG